MLHYYCKKSKVDINYKVGLPCFSAEIYFLIYQFNSM